MRLSPLYAKKSGRRNDDPSALLPQSELRDQRTIAFDVVLFEIVEQVASLADHLFETSHAVEVLFVDGEVLVEPKIMLPTNSVCCRLPGTDGKAKMSKSLGNCIYLSDEQKEMQQKVKSMYTDPGHLRVEDPGKVEGNTVFTYLDAFSTEDDFAEFWPEYKNLEELKDHYRRGGLGDMKCKKFLIKVLDRQLEPIRQRRHEFEQDIPEVYNILKKGSDAAREVAAQTLHEVREAMKINYFDDLELIKEQAMKYQGK